MLSDETIEKLSEIIVQRIEDVNTYTLNQIAQSLKKIKDLSNTDTIKLARILQYGGDYDKIKRKLKQTTDLNLKDIDKIFENVAKKNQTFAKQFYDYRKVKFIPYEENKYLQDQVKAIANITKQNYIGFANTIGYTRIVKGKRVFTKLSKLYNKVIEQGILAVNQGKDTVDQVIHNIVKELASSGLRTIDYGRTYIGKDGKEHYYTRRLDSAVRMNIMDGTRSLSNDINIQFGKEFGSDGVEITVHDYPAPDHAQVQGHQFYNEQFENFQNDRKAIDVDGVVFESEYEGHDRRSISQYNCWHRVFPIIVGVSNPQYSKEQLQKIIDQNEEGFKYNDKHYTLYQGTQMQRNIETEIRKQKDQYMMAQVVGDQKLMDQSSNQIKILNRQYKYLNNQSGLLARPERLRVPGYKRKKSN